MRSVTANAAEIPLIGLGTWQLRGDACAGMVAQALQLGYRHVDTAAAYENEREVGEGLRRSGVPPEEVWITTKVWPDRFRDGDLQRSVEESLARLGMYHADLVLLHWPSRDVPLAGTIRALNDAARRGLARHIGVSNFTVALVEQAVALSEVPIVANQIEFHPYLDQSKVIAACRRRGLAVTAYSPIAKGRVADDPVIRAIAERHGKTPAQVALRWLVQQNVIAIPRSSKPERLKENLDVFDFALSDDDMRRMSGLSRSEGRLVNVSWAPAWD